MAGFHNLLCKVVSRGTEILTFVLSTAPLPIGNLDSSQGPPQARNLALLLPVFPFPFLFPFGFWSKGVCVLGGRLEGGGGTVQGANMAWSSPWKPGLPGQEFGMGPEVASLLQGHKFGKKTGERAQAACQHFLPVWQAHQ